MNELKCAGCGKKLLTYDNTSFRQYKSPVKQCKKCGTYYLDPRCHEIAVEGVPDAEFSVGSYIVLIVFGGLVGYRGIYLSSRTQLHTPEGAQWVLPTMFVLMGIVFILGGIVELIRIKTGAKARKYEKLREESEQRLQNRSYAYQLRDLGYPVPEEYL
ncbi:MAG: hypothetical protein K2H89_06150 [Oscillospiraceae bacterium]|nr:hypothetical protein [Oscillospiraceae bacterium]